MKNLFFALAFMFIGSFAFANNTTTETLNTNAIELTEAITTPQVIDTEIEIEVEVTVTDYYVDGEYVGSTVEVEITITITP